MNELSVESVDKTKKITIDFRFVGAVARDVANNSDDSVYHGYFQKRNLAEEPWSEPLQVAVKRVPILLEENLNSPQQRAAERRRRKKNERELFALLLLDHPNVSKMFHYQDAQQFRYIARELSAASLHDYSTVLEVKEKIGLLNEFTVILHLARALEYINSKKLVHRNIHPRNVLIHQSADAPVTIKLVDFGYCKMATEGGSVSHSQDNPGGEAFRAPELFDDGDDLGISEKKGYISSDVFSIGCVLFFFLCGGLNLFGGGTSIQGNIINGNDVNSESLPPVYEFFKNLIKNMTKSEPKERISPAQIIQQLPLQEPVAENQENDAAAFDFMQ